jgi:hypothetical protein
MLLFFQIPPNCLGVMFLAVIDKGEIKAFGEIQ